MRTIRRRADAEMAMESLVKEHGPAFRRLRQYPCMAGGYEGGKLPPSVRAIRDMIAPIAARTPMYHVPQYWR